MMNDRNLRWDPNFTGPWWLMFPGYNEPDSPFHDKRVRQAISLALNRPISPPAAGDARHRTSSGAIGSDRNTLTP